MRKEKSLTRERYERSYRMLRQGCELEIHDGMSKSRSDARKAADYSYQASLYVVHGWSDNRRRARFHQIKWRVLSREELPF